MGTKGYWRKAAMLSGALMLTLPASAPALAQAGKDAKADASDEIVVTGKVESPPAEVRKQARAITANVGAIFHTPLAQFQDPVCPGISGMTRELAEIMVERIRANAEKIGLDVAREGKCDPNILVGFVINGQKTIKDLKAKKGYVFRNIDLHELKKMAADAGPVHAWVNTLVRSRQGDVMQGDNDADLTQVPTLNVGQSQSHIFLATRLDITNSIILIDIKAANGMSVVQLADYVTMRTFARTRPVEGDAAMNTILSLFDPGSTRVPELTDFDIAYLRSIYGGIPNLNAASKLASINKNLREQQAARGAEE